MRQLDGYKAHIASIQGSGVFSTQYYVALMNRVIDLDLETKERNKQINQGKV